VDGSVFTRLSLHLPSALPHPPTLPTSYALLRAIISADHLHSFSVDDLKVLLHNCSIRPVVNQIKIEPYVIKETQPLLDFMAHQHIVPEGYSTLIPLTSEPGGPVDKPMYEIAKRLGVKPEQVLLAWSNAKGWVHVKVDETDEANNFPALSLSLPRARRSVSKRTSPRETSS
jgi:diketogulonate reductase-like aldo/keto reductase